MNKKRVLQVLLTFLCLACLSFVYATSYRSKSVAQSGYQVPVGCYQWQITFTPCGDNATCGLGEYRSNEFQTGPGNQGIIYQAAACEGTNCGSINNIPRAVDNPSCVTPTPTPTPNESGGWR